MIIPVAFCVKEFVDGSSCILVIKYSIHDEVSILGQLLNFLHVLIDEFVAKEDLEHQSDRHHTNYV